MKLDDVTHYKIIQRAQSELARAYYIAGKVADEVKILVLHEPVATAETLSKTSLNK